MMIAPKRVSSGKYIDLGDFSVDQVDIEDINKSLNYLYRFTGHHKDAEPLTVAQHTLLCIKISEIFFPNEEDVKFDCLLHDMPEAYTGDIATPLKRMFGDSYKKYNQWIEDIVYTALWKIDTPFTEEVMHKRRVCDLMSLDIERRVMWKSQLGKNMWPEEPDNPFNMNDKAELFREVQSKRFVNLVDIYNSF